MDPQIEEMIFRLKNLLPKVSQDSRFVLNLGISEAGPIPIVYLAADQAADQSLPHKYIIILKKAENQYAMRFEGFCDMTHFLVPVPWWPTLVSGEELDRLVIEVFEGWLGVCEAMAKQLENQSGPDLTSLPL